MGRCALTNRTAVKSSSRAGFTLFEIILVLALMILIGSLVAPAFSRTFENQRLKESGDIVRTAMAEGRIESMKSGRTMLFRYEIGGNHYILEPWQGADDYLEMGDVAAATMILAQPQSLDDTQPVTTPPAKGSHTSLALFNRIQELPEGISFYGSQQDPSVRDRVIQKQLQVDPNLNTLAQWSAPVLFYPDGSASQTEVRLVNTGLNRFVLVRLRGLTGIAYVTDIRTLSEMDLDIQ